MSERLFDDAAPRRYSLVRLAATLAGVLADVGTIIVEGEVHRATERYGRTYFTLRDRAAQINVVCPPSRNARFRTVDGERVAVTGKMTWRNDQGAVHLVASEVAPVGAGAVAAAISEARARLDVEGLLSRPRRPLPLLPVCVGVICGAEAAVRADIESVIASRFPGYPVRFLEVGVAGAGAAERIIAALAELAGQPDIDVIVLARGGGDATQMLPFSDEALCRAVAASSKVIVSAIGHQGDAPLCDEVADVRCATPSVAASQVFPSRAALDDRLNALALSIDRAISDHTTRARQIVNDRHPAATLDAALARCRARADRGKDRSALLHPGPAARAARTRLAGIRWRDPLPLRVSGGRVALAASTRQMDALSPQRVLERGYAVARTLDGSVVRDAGTLGQGAMLEIQVARGRAITKVEETTS